MNSRPDSSCQQPRGAAPAIEIRVGMPKPWTHCFEIGMTVSGITRDALDFVMPVWTPGSYLIREFARNVQGFAVVDESGRSLDWEKISKNTWRVHSHRVSKLTVGYRVYAFERSVRTNFLDDSHGYINGAGLFMYVDGHERCAYRLAIEPYPGWEHISTGLDRLRGAENTFLAPDFDTLVDCPIEMGNQRLLEFSVRGVPHFIAVYGEGNLDAGMLRNDAKKLVEAAIEIVGDIPYKHFTFLLHLTSEGWCGLEHSNSASLQVHRWTFRPKESYHRFLELLAHEYFHVWNVKRIRPLTLGPFDYTRENYTRLLWVSEGLTDYYAGQILRRSGIITPDDYLTTHSKIIKDFLETPGRLVESAAEASFDAWIKFYRQDAHSPNVTISHYTKGSLIGLVLDLEILNRARDRCLDDVMRLLYREYYQKLGRGFTDDEFRRACEDVAGGPLDEIFESYCCGTKEMDLAHYLGYAGLVLVNPQRDADAPPKSCLGISAKTVDGKLLVTGVTAGSPAFEQGLNLNDEIIAFNRFRVNQEILTARIEEAAPGSTVELLISRDGRLRKVVLILGEKVEVAYKIERMAQPTEAQKRVYESWLRAEWKSPRKRESGNHI